MSAPDVSVVSMGLRSVMTWGRWGLLILGFVCLSLFALRQAELTGDGKEYLLYAHAFSSHLSPDIRASDVEYVNGYLQKIGSDLHLDFETLGEGQQFSGGARFDGMGFVKAEGGRIYAWHYWLYSLCVTPFLVLVRAAGGVPESAFVLCNLAYVLGVLIYILRWWKAGPLVQCLLAGLFLTTGTTYYVWWSHPEVFTASLVLLGLLAASDRRYGLGMWALAVAATQNPPLLFLMVMVLVTAFVLPAGRKGDVQGPLFSAKRLLHPISLGGPALVFALTPAVFYLLEIGVANPIAAAGWADLSLLSPGRLVSMFFDLNMGMVVGLPVVTVVAVALPIFALGGALLGLGCTEAMRRYALPVSAGVLASVVIAVPALTATNWNHGQAAFSRYAYWVAMPVVLGVSVCVGRLPRRLSIVLAACLLITQFACVAYYGVWGKNWRATYLAFKPFVPFVLLNHPGLYSPLPEIFAERLVQRENVLDGTPPKNSRFVFPDLEHPTKILLRASAAESGAQLFRAKCSAVSVDYVEKSWAYINIPMTCYTKP